MRQSNEKVVQQRSSEKLIIYCEGLSKSSMQVFSDLSATDVSKLTMSSAMDGTGGALSIGNFFQIDKFKKR